jgi:hypothetical protein
LGRSGAPPLLTDATGTQLPGSLSFGPEDAAPFLGFGLISGGAFWFLAGILRQLLLSEVS